MALDGMFLYAIKQELSSLLQMRVDRIFQPAKQELIFVMRGKEGGRRLLLSAHADHARVQITDIATQNPKSPPMFCMFLRKRLTGAKLIAIRQPSLERVLFLDFAAHNELGAPQEITLAVEIMGRHSNIILVQDGRILEAIKRVEPDMSHARPILPGMDYALPPLQSKLSILAVNNQEIFQRVDSLRNLALEKALLNTLQGISPIVARELSLQGREFLEQKLLLLRETLTKSDFCFNAVIEGARPRDFSFLPITQYGDLCENKVFSTASELLDYFYHERDRIIRMKEKSGQLFKLLENTQSRLIRKLQVRHEELLRAESRDDYRMYGDLLNANLHSLKKGQTEAVVENFYGEVGERIKIPLDPKKTPAQNAQSYYKEYKRAQTARKLLQDLILQGKEELEYIDSVITLLSLSEIEQDLTDIRRELTLQGYIKKQTDSKRKEKAAQPLFFRSTDGFMILSGRNNLQNDVLTLKSSSKHDIWCHTQKIHGSHVVVVSEGRDVPDETIQQACMIAAFYSKARDSAQVPVDYTQIRYVKKPVGAKPGMVIYTHQKTAFVTPNEEFIDNLRVRK